MVPYGSINGVLRSLLVLLVPCCTLRIKWMSRQYKASAWQRVFGTSGSSARKYYYFLKLMDGSTTGGHTVTLQHQEIDVFNIVQVKVLQLKLVMLNHAVIYIHILQTHPTHNYLATLVPILDTQYGFFSSAVSLPNNTPKQSLGLPPVYTLCHWSSACHCRQGAHIARCIGSCTGDEAKPPSTYRGGSPDVRLHQDEDTQIGTLGRQVGF